jgi:hypothetical protein
LARTVAWRTTGKAPPADVALRVPPCSRIPPKADGLGVASFPRNPRPKAVFRLAPAPNPFPQLPFLNLFPVPSGSENPSGRNPARAGVPARWK